MLNGDSFRYLGEWRGDNSAVLEFAADIDGITINSVTSIHRRRPHRSLQGDGASAQGHQLLHRMMAEQLATVRR